MTVVSMSEREFSRLDVLSDLDARRIRIGDACDLLGLKRRQVFRLLRGLRDRGAVALVSARRSRPSNNRLPAQVRDLAVAIIRERYCDFGPTLAGEKLAQLHGCRVSRETLRKWMIDFGTQVSQGKTLMLRSSAAGFTCVRVRMIFGRPRPLPGYPTAPAFYPVSVRRL